MNEQQLKKRIYSIDLLRGLVMIIMALDHTRDFIHYDSFVHDPLDLETTTAGLFFTRWITHFCAPIFVFLSGTSIFLQSLRKSKAELSSFLFKRGLWLIFVEVIIITFAWTFDFTFGTLVLQVIWAIGICMVLMGLITRLPYKLIFALGLLIVLGHNVFDSIESTHKGFLWDLMRNGDFAAYPLGGGHTLLIIYPFLPWLGLMMMGYCLGKLFEPSFTPSRRKALLMRLGLGLIALFILLRLSNSYGNPSQWQPYANSFLTVLSFINVHKYPPSLLFMCMTIGPALLFLSLFENSNTGISKKIAVYGQVPFFYYVLHFYIIHMVCMVLFLTRGHSITETTPDIFGTYFRFLVQGEGYSLKVVYLVWILVVLALYPLCKWFSEYKKIKKNWWLSYL